MSNAFDRVWHNGLLFKIKHYGVAGNILYWMEHYLTDRKQKVTEANLGPIKILY